MIFSLLILWYSFLFPFFICSPFFFFFFFECWLLWCIVHWFPVEFIYIDFSLFLLFFSFVLWLVLNLCSRQIELRLLFWSDHRVFAPYFSKVDLLYISVHPHVVNPNNYYKHIIITIDFSISNFYIQFGLKSWSGFS